MPQCVHGDPPCKSKTLGRNKPADVIEALFGIVFDASGMGGAVVWLQHFGILPAPSDVKLRIFPVCVPKERNWCGAGDC